MLEFDACLEACHLKGKKCDSTSFRKVKHGETYDQYMDNQIHTSIYNNINFLPKNLLLQFSKMANFYFLILMILQVGGS
jgi:phospholipid-transporting ATPase